MLAGLTAFWGNYLWPFALCHTAPLNPSEMTRSSAGWRPNRELTPIPAQTAFRDARFLPDAAGVFMHQRLAFGAAERFRKLRHISDGVIHSIFGHRVGIGEDDCAHDFRPQLGAPIVCE